MLPHRRSTRSATTLDLLMLRSLSPSTESRSLETEGEDVAAADIAFEALIPDGWELHGSQYKKVPMGSQ